MFGNLFGKKKIDDSKSSDSVKKDAVSQSASTTLQTPSVASPSEPVVTDIGKSTSTETSSGTISADSGKSTSVDLTSTVSNPVSESALTSPSASESSISAENHVWTPSVNTVENANVSSESVDLAKSVEINETSTPVSAEQPSPTLDSNLPTASDVKLPETSGNAPVIEDATSKVSPSVQTTEANLAKDELLKIEKNVVTSSSATDATPKSKKKNAVPENVHYAVGINLLPKLTKKQIDVIETKTNFNVGSAVLILVFMFITLVIISVNLVTKVELNNIKSILYNDLEVDASVYDEVFRKNKEINNKIDLYTTIREKTVSHKEVLNFWMQTSSGLVEITDIQLTDGLGFTVSGTSNSLEDVAKFWHLLCVDENIEEVNLKSVGTGETEVNFEFEGTLNFENFKKS